MTANVLEDTYWTLLIIAAALCVYMLPTIIASERKVSNLGSVAVINVLLGWTLVGWAVAMAMAARTVAKPSATTTRDCPHCLEPVKVGATVCPHCQRDIAAAVV